MHLFSVQIRHECEPTPSVLQLVESLRGSVCSSQSQERIQSQSFSIAPLQTDFTRTQEAAAQTLQEPRQTNTCRSFTDSSSSVGGNTSVK
ncbi:hypothetical protein PBY51_024969 [Eleginops maclovinus]|uniref:Uncharacterized protein n=1 Tax=Eleginops maclovinus TaxID=56733 RepID=A0AAN7XXM5_ELEMC|nr:hypothetical protein PBY51_024969 [Eleginops maclovinus]